MGWKEKLSNIKEGAKGKFKAAKKTIQDGTFCTNVLNDFSFVKKALFQVYFREGQVDTQGGKRFEWSFKMREQFPVQINPSDIDIEFGKSVRTHDKGRKEMTTLGGSVPLTTILDEKYEPGTTTINLTYNIYDDYNARTANGALVENSVSLQSQDPDDESYTSLSKLKQYAGRTGYYVLFRWGEIHIFGILSDVSVKYTVFSPWGQPLVGDATVTIKQQPLAFSNDDVEVDPCASGLLDTVGETKAKAYDEKAKIARRLYQGINAMR